MGQVEIVDIEMSYWEESKFGTSRKRWNNIHTY